MQDEAIFYFTGGILWEIRHSPRFFSNFLHHQGNLPQFRLDNFILSWIMSQNRGIGGLRNVDNYLRQIYRM
jgi:hypothetical protein